MAMPTKTEYILIVEENNLVGEVLRIDLELDHFKVFAATTGNRALEILMSHQDQIRLMILDHLIPDMDFEVLIAEARRITPSIRILLITDFPDAIQTEALPNDGILAKPITMPAFHQTVLELLE